MACLLVAASATPYSYYYKSSGQPYTYQQYKYPTQAPYQAAPAVKPYVPATSYSQGATGWDWSSLADFSKIGQYINDPYYALEKSQSLLEDLNKGLPDALAKMDPAIKDDIKQVNNLVLDICNKAVANARPTTATSYYSPEGIKSTCAFLQKHVPTVSRGMDDPAVITNLISKLGEFGRLAGEMGDLMA